jgi:hypothetical protein
VEAGPASEIVLREALLCPHFAEPLAERDRQS